MGLHSGASGKVMMAYLSEEQQNKIIQEKGLKKFTAYTIIDPLLLKRNLQKIRKVGYATSDQEFTLGVRAIAAPIFDFNNRIIASICVVGPRERLTIRKMSFLVDNVLEAAREITKRLGGETK
jgi:IclR family acetate operon transcriptional repressor